LNIVFLQLKQEAIQAGGNSKDKEAKAGGNLLNRLGTIYPAIWESIHSKLNNINC